MQTVDRRKITIVAESVLEDRILRELRSLGATGYTITDARGEGSRGRRTMDLGGRNIRVEVVAGAALADAILAHVAEHYFEHFAVIAWVDDVEVVRGDKYG
jgi:nitrogen regulatory protein P-II 2